MLRHIKAIAFLTLLMAGSSTATPPRAAKVAGPDTRPESGNGLFKSYCASCHGLSGKGDGPAAAAMRMQPTDLTQLTRRAKGEFPAARLEKMLGGSDGITAHGGKQMPVWGPALSVAGVTDTRTAQRVRNLIAYIQSIQDKAR